MQNTLTVTQYEEMTDMFTVEVTTVVRKNVPAAQIQQLHEIYQKYPHLMFTEEERAMIKLFDQHFEEEPTDLCQQTINF